MKEKFIENGIEYVRNGDYYIPNLKAPEGTYNIGRYGRLHSIFIKENRPCIYSMKMLNGICHNRTLYACVLGSCKNYIGSVFQNSPAREGCKGL